MFFAFIMAMIALVALAIVSHMFLPVVAGAIAVGTGMWLIMIFSIIAFSVIIMGVFIATSMGVVVLAVIGAAWLIASLVLFPLVFPVLLPLFIVFLFMIFVRRRRYKKRIDAPASAEK